MRIGESTFLKISSQMSQTQKSLSRALERLSTGKRINSPRDDFAGFSVATNLDSRVRGLRQASLNLNSVWGVLGTAENALSAQLDIVQKMRELAVQLANGVLTGTDRASIQTQLISLREEYDRIVQSTEFNGLNPINGSTGELSFQGGASSGDSLDIVLSDLSSNKIFTKNVGIGNFSEASSISSTDYSTKETADLNGDGELDLVTSTGSRISVYLGDGQGGFSLKATFSASAGQIALDDFNGDGVADLRFTSGLDLILKLGNGDGSFGAQKVLGGSNIGDVGDIDGDGSNEFVFYDSGALSIFEIGSDASISLNQTLFENDQASFDDVFIEDLDGDGDQDIFFHSTVVVGLATFSLGFLVNNGSGSFNLTGTSLDVLSLSPNNIEVVDIQGDGLFEIVAANEGNADILVLGLNSELSGGSITSLATAVGTENVQDISVGDFNSDGLLDVLAIGDDFLSSEARLNIFFGQSDGSLLASSISYAAGDFNGDITVGDFNGDGVLDFIGNGSDSGNLALYQGNFTTQSAVSDLAAYTSEDAKDLIGILDQAITKINQAQVSLGIQSSLLESRANSNLLLSENLAEAKSLIEDVDIAEETSKLVAAQILQQAQIAAFSQDNLNAQIVLQILDGIR